MNSIEALTKGLSDGGCENVFNFPGYKSHTVFSLLGGKQISLNEKVAYEEAYGSCLGGKRTVVSFKNVGLNVAADPFLNSLIAGVNAGLVVVVTDDIDVSDSQNRMDSRHYFDFYGGLWLEPYNMQSAYDLAYKAFQWSEKFDMPVVIRLTNKFFELTGDVEIREAVKFNGKLLKNPEKLIVHPTNWKKQAKNLENKNSRLKEFIESLYRNQNVANIKSIGFGCAEGDLKIYTYPIPEKLISLIWQLGQSINVYEAGDDFGIEKLRLAVCMDKKFERRENVVPDLDGTYRVWKDLEKLFEAIKESNPEYVVSDLAQFTRETTGTIDACLCMGSSIAVGIGLALAGVSNPICIAGDVSFMHGGTDILREAILRGVKMQVIMVDNGGSWCTGGQKPVGTGLPESVKKINLKTLDYQASSKTDIYKLLADMKTFDGVSMLTISIK